MNPVECWVCAKFICYSETPDLQVFCSTRCMDVIMAKDQVIEPDVPPTSKT